ncbi:DUF4185 domain-containing protein [Flavobacteriaceae bacterium F89]|uniref:DUF4185 domain-containing protein n=1 Tax=Cerina litoralis TaxID=2874477 RepID=A0AAE3JRF1_9FLAO|nr:DUF4185 domain-containing protein [Cerina litoralis]MCG2462839.1 DUF4185 domain-containing protein [Cerina litoralis]
MKVALFSVVAVISFVLRGQDIPQPDKSQVAVESIDNSMFTNNKIWRGADGGATIDLGKGKILWLFSDTFIDTLATGKRRNSKIINNSIAIQDGNSLADSKISFYYRGTREKPKSFFELPGDTWFWTGHGTIVKDKLIIFLFEEKKTNTAFGFESIGWRVAIIENPNDKPQKWRITYSRELDTFGVIVGSSAVLKDKDFIYAYGVLEPGSHEVYLLRFPIDNIIDGDLSGLQWWMNGIWKTRTSLDPKPTPLFKGQTEFSIHYQPNLGKFIQIQTYGFGDASLGYRLATRLEGPWSKPVIFYKPELDDQKDFVYTANAHPELNNDGIIISYNVNNFDFERLLSNENIYFPRLIKINFIK